MKKLVGLVGFKQSGKSTVASYIESKYGFVRHNFKNALILEIKQNFPDLLNEIVINYNVAVRDYNSAYDKSMWLPEIEVDGLFEKKPPLIRTLMMNYGTEVRRKEKDSYWTDKWLEKYLTIEKQNVVVDDVRFLNEASRIKGQTGIIIRIARTDITTGGGHSSETEQLQIEADFTIKVNPGEHEKLYAELDVIMQK